MYRTYTRPIAKVPGPWYTNWTAIVQKSYLFQGKGPMYAYDLHKKYGTLFLFFFLASLERVCWIDVPPCALFSFPRFARSYH